MKKFIKKYVILILVIGLVLKPYEIYAEESTSIEQKVDNFKLLFEFILENYVGEEVTEEELFEAAMDGMFSELDAYSEFYSKEEAKDFAESVSGEFVGVGIEIISEDNWVKVVRPIPNSPAYEAGVKTGDIITFINGESAKGLTPTQAANKIKGEEGTIVSITFKRGIEEYTVDIARATVKLSAVESKDIKNIFPELEEDVTNKINYISINSFNANVADDLTPYLLSAMDNGVEYLILDLRDNPGGYVDSAVDICNLLIPEGPVLHFVDKEGRKKTYTSELKNAPFEIAVLTNENTASASEFMAAAVKESGIGFTVGENTYGKGVAQYIYTLSDGYSFKMTMEEFYSRDENKINGVGVAPDYEVIIPSYITSEERLYPKDESEQVKNLEYILQYLGYDVDAPDMIYDQKTENAIFDFQRDVSLYPYGVCDFSTQKALNDALIEEVNGNDAQLNKALDIILEKMNEI